jgi:hypothetical protein
MSSSLQAIYLTWKLYKSLRGPFRTNPSKRPTLIGQVAESLLHIRVQLLNRLGDFFLSLVGVLESKVSAMIQCVSPRVSPRIFAGSACRECRLFRLGSAEGLAIDEGNRGQGIPLCRSILPLRPSEQDRNTASLHQVSAYIQAVIPVTHMTAPSKRSCTWGTF